MNSPSEAHQPPPIGMLAELTHRCPLQCPYCSNPVELTRKREELDTETWQRVFHEAAELGVLQVHLSGGEPALRQDLEALVASCAEHGLYSNLITAGVNISRARLEALADAGLDHVQLSVQGATAEVNDHIANLPGAFDKKLAFAAEVTDVSLPLTLNSVIHRANLHQIPDLVELALGRTGLRDAVRAIVARDEVEHGKPAPDLYLKAGELLGFAAGEMLAFEDSLVGVQAAQAAGVPVVGVPTMGQDGFAPDFLFGSLADPVLQAWAAAL